MNQRFNNPFGPDRNASLRQLENVERLFRICKLIGEEGALLSVFERPVNEVDICIQKYLRCQRELTGSVDDTPNSGSLLYLLSLGSFSGTLHFLSSETGSSETRNKLLNVRSEINEMIIERANPFVITFFKWDLDRRKWRRAKDKLSYLRKTLNILEEELLGQRDNLIRKYVTLFFQYLLYHHDQITSNAPSDFFEKYGINREESIATRDKLKSLTEENKIGDAIDNELEQSILQEYKPLVQKIQEGLSVADGKYDYLLAAFIEAQIDFKNIVQSLIESLTDEKVDDLRHSLIRQDIVKFISLVHAIFASTPHQLLKNTTEAYFHINLHVMLRAIGCDIESEVSTNKGRIDSVIEFDELIYIVEYKLDGSESAMEQIEKRRYFEKYLSSRKRIFLLGLSFDLTDKNIRREHVFKELTRQ